MKVLQFTIPVQYGKAIFTRIDVLPHFYPYLHRHKEMQVTWVQQGHGTLVTDNNMHLFQDNDVFVIGANQPHVFKNTASYFTESKCVRSLDIFFDPDKVCNSLLNIPELKHLREFIYKSQAGFKIPGNCLQEVAEKMQSMHKLENGVARITQFIELLQLFAAAPCEKLSAENIVLRTNEDEGMRISQVYNFILHNYAQNITLADTAAQAYMTQQAFCRFFKKHTRHTFVSFLTEIRVNEAIKQLAEGKYDSISGVAYGCGFKSITNFNRSFKSVTGQAPGAYIKSLKQKVQMRGS